MGQNVFYMFFVLFKEKNAPASLLVQYGWSPCWACWARCNQDVIKKKIYCFEKKPSSSKRKSNIWKAVCINTNKPAEKCDILQKQFWFIVLLTFIKNWLWRGLQVLWFIAWFINASKLLWYLTWQTKTLLCFSRIHRADEEAKKGPFSLLIPTLSLFVPSSSELQTSECIASSSHSKICRGRWKARRQH